MEPVHKLDNVSTRLGLAITGKGGWYFSSANAEAMRDAIERCENAGVKCWLYAVDERVVWQSEVAARIDSARLQPNP